LYDRKRFRARNSLREVSVFDVETALATGDVFRRVDEVTEHTGTEENDVKVKRTTTDGEGDDDGVARSADAADTAAAAASKNNIERRRKSFFAIAADVTGSALPRVRLFAANRGLGRGEGGRGRWGDHETAVFW
jgi:hypothetical protein